MARGVPHPGEVAARGDVPIAFELGAAHVLGEVLQPRQVGRVEGEQARVVPPLRRDEDLELGRPGGVEHRGARAPARPVRRRPAIPESGR